MYIDRIRLENIRGFSGLDFKLSRGQGRYAGWTVFTGDNGSGKSSLLKAIAIALTGKDTARALQPSFHRWMREGEHEAAIELQIVRCADDDSLADVLRHLIGTYGAPGLTERGADGKLFVKRSGVVLIDEIDAHLHPEWQREVGFWLKRHFPNIQFLVTTHSPIICQAADENGLFVLPEPGSDELPHGLTDDEYRTVIASRPDTILLTPAFVLQNTRSPRAVEGRAQYAKLMAKQRASGQLSADERGRAQQLALFAATNEEP